MFLIFLLLFTGFVPELLQKVQAVQTDNTTEELGVNTEPDWESHVAAMLEHSSSLTEQYDSLMRKQDDEEVAHEKDKQQVQKKKEEATRHHQVGLTQRHTHRLKIYRSVFYHQTVTVFSGSSGQTGVSASEAAAEQLQGHQEELLSQETGNDLREEQSRGGEEQVKTTNTWK